MPRILFLVIREDLNMEEPSIPTDVKRHQRKNERILSFLKATGLVEHVMSWGFRNAVCPKNYFRFLGSPPLNGSVHCGYTVSNLPPCTQ